MQRHNGTSCTNMNNFHARKRRLGLTRCLEGDAANMLGSLCKMMKIARFPTLTIFAVEEEAAAAGQGRESDIKLGSGNYRRISSPLMGYLYHHTPRGHN
jgi:hypothetical protein